MIVGQWTPTSTCTGNSSRWTARHVLRLWGQEGTSAGRVQRPSTDADGQVPSEPISEHGMAWPPGPGSTGTARHPGKFLDSEQHQVSWTFAPTLYDDDFGPRRPPGSLQQHRGPRTGDAARTSAGGACWLCAAEAGEKGRGLAGVGRWALVHRSYRSHVPLGAMDRCPMPDKPFWPNEVFSFRVRGVCR